MVVSLSLGIKVWDILFYLPGESDAASSLDFYGVILFMVRDVLETHWITFPHDCIEIGWIELKFASFYLASRDILFWFLLQTMYLIFYNDLEDENFRARRGPRVLPFGKGTSPN